jgi:hypothetical protein
MLRACSLIADIQDVCTPPNSGPMMKQIAESLCKQKHAVRTLLDYLLLIPI